MLSIAALFFVASCTNESQTIDLIDAESNKTDLFGKTVENINGTLAFESKEQLDETVALIFEQLVTNNLSLRSQTTVSADLTSVNFLREKGFISLYDVFVDAMNNAEEYYERPGGYEEFKKKYPTLYFPEYEDDYSAYLPVSDKHLARLADVNGNVIINGETISLKDISSYEQLQELGQAPPSNYEMTTRSADYVGTNKISDKYDGSHKAWVNTKATGYPHSFTPAIMVEFCFRKKFCRYLL
jgi:hypothetical protein